MSSTPSTTRRSDRSWWHASGTQTRVSPRARRAGRRSRHGSIWLGRSSIGIVSGSGMTLLPVAGRPASAMAEEFENYEARLEEARRAVERWDAEGGEPATEHPADQTPETMPAAEQAMAPDASTRQEHNH